MGPLVSCRSVVQWPESGAGNKHLSRREKKMKDDGTVRTESIGF